PLGPGPLSAFRDRLAVAAAGVHDLIAPRLGGGRAPHARAIESGLRVLLHHEREDEDVDLFSLKVWIDEAMPEKLTDHLRKWVKGPGNAAEAVLFEGTDLPARADELSRLLRHWRRIDPELLQAGRQALAPLLAAVERELRARGIATFDALLTGAESLLARHPEVRSRVRRQIDQLL